MYACMHTMLLTFGDNIQVQQDLARFPDPAHLPALALAHELGVEELRMKLARILKM